MQPRTTEQTVERMTQPTFGFFETVPSQFYWLFAIGSIFVSAYLFLTGRRAWALFVGQWPPTILVLTLFYKMLRPSREEPMRGMQEAMREVRRTA
ncbi:MAG: hypothetical protein HY331_17720 [Chloroflexi bacterium]|nr:hypothetical protein [Chloroflexota bacterium]